MSSSSERQIINTNTRERERRQHETPECREQSLQGRRDSDRNAKRKISDLPHVLISRLACWRRKTSVRFKPDCWFTPHITLSMVSCCLIKIVTWLIVFAVANHSFLVALPRSLTAWSLCSQRERRQHSSKDYTDQLISSPVMGYVGSPD